MLDFCCCCCCPNSQPRLLPLRLSCDQSGFPCCSETGAASLQGVMLLCCVALWRLIRCLVTRGTPDCCQRKQHTTQNTQHRTHNTQHTTSVRRQNIISRSFVPLTYAHAHTSLHNLLCSVTRVTWWPGGDPGDPGDPADPRGQRGAQSGEGEEGRGEEIFKDS